MFRKKLINASSNLKRGLHLETKIKSNESLNIGTELKYRNGGSTIYWINVVHISLSPRHSISESSFNLIFFLGVIYLL